MQYFTYNTVGEGRLVFLKSGPGEEPVVEAADEEPNAAPDFGNADVANTLMESIDSKVLGDLVFRRPFGDERDNEALRKYLSTADAEFGHEAVRTALKEVLDAIDWRHFLKLSKIDDYAPYLDREYVVGMIKLAFNEEDARPQPLLYRSKPLAKYLDSKEELEVFGPVVDKLIVEREYEMILRYADSFPIKDNPAMKNKVVRAVQIAFSHIVSSDEYYNAPEYAANCMPILSGSLMYYPYALTELKKAVRKLQDDSTLEHAGSYGQSLDEVQPGFVHGLVNKVVDHYLEDEGNLSEYIILSSVDGYAKYFAPGKLDRLLRKAEFKARSGTVDKFRSVYEKYLSRDKENDEDDREY